MTRIIYPKLYNLRHWVVKCGAFLRAGVYNSDFAISIQEKFKMMVFSPVWVYNLIATGFDASLGRVYNCETRFSALTFV